MINRILIRIKVVQMLYSYLLTRSEFKIETMPENPTRDKKYSYTIYFDLILLILRLSGYNIGANNQLLYTKFDAFSNSKLAKALLSIDEIKSLITKEKHTLCNYDIITNDLYKLIISSVAYKDFKKIKTPEIQDEVKFWNIILLSIILKNQKFIEAARVDDNFTIKGFEAGIKMLVDTLSNYSDTHTTLNEARKSLFKSLDKSQELYYSIFKLIIDLTQMQCQRLDAAKTKYLPTVDDLNPNTRFIDNRLVNALETSEEFNDYLSSNPITWNDDPLFLKKLLDKIIASEIYKQYMDAEVVTFTDDCAFWRNILKSIIFDDEDFIDALEAKSPYWNDDLHIIGTFIIKTIKNIANSQTEKVEFIPQFKDDEDAEFGPQLFAETINNFDVYRGYIDQFISKQWDSDRLAFMDIIIMSTAIAEMLRFPLIPIPVTLNEYIEIANSYSTSKSGQFINGILYSVINFLKKEGLLNK